jgi:hypothetical protein
VNDIQEARARTQKLLDSLRERGVDAGEFGEDLDTLLAATAPKSHRDPKPREPRKLVRRNDPDTSWEAAISASSKNFKALYTDILRVLQQVSSHLTGLTDEQLVSILTKTLGRSYSPSGVRTRRSELVDAGWVRDSGARHPTQSGKPAIVWEFVPEVDS